MAFWNVLETKLLAVIAFAVGVIFVTGVDVAAFAGVGAGAFDSFVVIFTLSPLCVLNKLTCGLVTVAVAFQENGYAPFFGIAWG